LGNNPGSAADEEYGDDSIWRGPMPWASRRGITNIRQLKGRIMRKLLLGNLVLCLCGCVGSPVHSSWTYGAVQKTIKRNNASLMDLKVGMSEEEVREIMGDPERSEGYPWGSAWLYRTAMTTGIYGTGDSDFTPVMFDTMGRLHGWGRNYFQEYVNKYEITIK